MRAGEDHGGKECSVIIVSNRYLALCHGEFIGSLVKIHDWPLTFSIFSSRMFLSGSILPALKKEKGLCRVVVVNEI